MFSGCDKMTPSKCAGVTAEFKVTTGKIDQMYPREPQQLWGKPRNDHKLSLVVLPRNWCTHIHMQVTIQYCRLCPAPSSCRCPKTQPDFTLPQLYQTFSAAFSPVGVTWKAWSSLCLGIEWQM